MRIIDLKIKRTGYVVSERKNHATNNLRVKILWHGGDWEWIDLPDARKKYKIQE